MSSKRIPIEMRTHGDIQVFDTHFADFADFADFEDIPWPVFQEGAVWS